MAGVVSGRFCDWQRPLGAAEQDRLLTFASLARHELEASGRRVAIVSRSGLDLARFGIRYTHAGIALAGHPRGAWSVRQLYYDCGEGRPQLFDQGLAGFTYGTDDPARGFLSIVLLPAAAAGALEAAALDDTRALSLLGGDYSANAFAFSTRYQNCNQWVAELLALAWGGPAIDGRALAQHWLAAHGYAPVPVAVDSHALMFASSFVPWLHHDDHPRDDLHALRFRTSLPAAIESFVEARWPQAERLELCHDGARAVVRRGGRPLADACVPEAGDRVVALADVTAGPPAPRR